MTQKNNRTHIGLAFYREEDWGRLLEISEDRGELEDSWLEWRENMKTAEQHIKAVGVSYEFVEIDLDELSAFCCERELGINSESRSLFIEEKIRSLYKKK